MPFWYADTISPAWGHDPDPESSGTTYVKRGGFLHEAGEVSAGDRSGFVEEVEGAARERPAEGLDPTEDGAVLRFAAGTPAVVALEAGQGGVGRALPPAEGAGGA